MVGITFDKEKIQLNIARLNKNGLNFEVAIDPDLAIKYKKGEKIDLIDILKSDKVFTDVKKGDLISENEMINAFGTAEYLKVAEEILVNGDIQLTAEYRQKTRDEKKNKIINLIHKNGLDPKTNLPHPITRIENAFLEAKITIDDFKSAEDQVKEIVRKLQPIIPIKIENKKIKVIVPAEFAGKAYPIVKSLAELKRDEWKNDGSWECEIEIPGGLLEEFYDKLNKITHGEVQTKEGE